MSHLSSFIQSVCTLLIIPESKVTICIILFFTACHYLNSVSTIWMSWREGRSTKQWHKEFQNKDGNMDLCFHFTWFLIEHWLSNLYIWWIVTSSENISDLDWAKVKILYIISPFKCRNQSEKTYLVRAWFASHNQSEDFTCEIKLLLSHRLGVIGLTFNLSYCH